MPLTFIDAGVLIAAARGTAEPSQRAIAILDQPERSFASSNFVRLEVLPKAIFNNRTNEAQFYSEFFRAVSHWAAENAKLTERAYEIATQFGLSAMDALHIAAALSLGAEEFITTERPGRPVYRVTGIRVHSIHVASAA